MIWAQSFAACIALAFVILSPHLLLSAQSAHDLVDSQPSYPIPLSTLSVSTSAPVVDRRPAWSVAPDGGFFASGTIAASSRGLIGGTAKGIVIVNPSTGDVSTLTDDSCSVLGLNDSVAVVRTNDCRGSKSGYFKGISLATGHSTWTTNDIIVTADGHAAIGQREAHGYLPGEPSPQWESELVGRDALTGKVLWNQPSPVSYRIQGGVILSGVALLYGSGESTGSYLTEVRSLSTGTLLDRDHDPYPTIIRTYGRWLLTSWGGVHFAAYEPARVKIYDTTIGALALNVDLEPDEQVENTQRNVRATYVALADDYLIIGISNDTYVYNLAALRKAQGAVEGKWPSPGKIVGIGDWLGFTAGDRLFFCNKAALLAVDVSMSRATVTQVGGAIGPFTSMVGVPGEPLGYALTTDRRILTIDLGKAIATRSTLAPDCYSLIRVETVNGRPVGLCTIAERGSVEALGL
jgi:hypothetical protein